MTCDGTMTSSGTSDELLKLEKKIGSNSAHEKDPLLIIEATKRKPIGPIDTSAILSRAKDFLDQAKHLDKPAEKIEEDSGSESEEEEGESGDHKVELNLLLFPETAVDNNTHLNRLKDLLLEEDDSTDSEEEDDITD